jgi:hypothetical protein
MDSALCDLSDFTHKTREHPQSSLVKFSYRFFSRLFRRISFQHIERHRIISDQTRKEKGYKSQKLLSVDKDYSQAEGIQLL